MLSAKSMGLALLAWALVAANAFLLGACSNTCCKPTNAQVFLDAAGEIDACYQYTNQGASCHTCCGKGSAFNGWCNLTNCDPNQVCNGTKTTYQYQIGGFGVNSCDVASAFNEVSHGCIMVAATKYDETLCTCGPAGSSATPCNN